MAEIQSDPIATHKRILDRKFDAAAWGLFFVWVGVALLANLSWGTALVGVGVIILGAQLARTYFALGLERFWLVAGILFVLGGAWELFRVQVGLVPILCIVVGIALLVSALTGSQNN
jgi:hypothetical protein